MADNLPRVQKDPSHCKSGKIRYGSKIEALLTLRETRGKGREEQRAYQCHLCEGGWHLTSAPWQSPSTLRERL
jgi:hypothetical protein